jgi:hypothetical protein
MNRKFHRQHREMASTPTPSECEEFEDAYKIAWDFWFELQTTKVSDKRFYKTTKYLDSIPGVSEYFRALCHYTITPQAPVYDVNRVA